MGWGQELYPAIASLSLGFILQNARDTFKLELNLMRRVCTVMDKFNLPGKGTAVTCIAEDDSLKLTPGASILLKRPGLPDLQTEVLGFEVFRNDWSPHKPRNFGLLLPAAVGTENVPSGSEVFADV